ncbi:MAG: DUF1997 domain-containing protein [Cyanobacteria bacterium P01_A01_bin.135]
MQANPQNPQIASDRLFNLASDFVASDGDPSTQKRAAADEHEPVAFHSRTASSMAMNASPEVVARYLDNHRDWFHRCAAPMQASSVGENGYDLKIGKFGAFGYDVEPRIGLELLPQDAGVYRIQTIPLPEPQFLGYEVDFQAAMTLSERAFRNQQTTLVDWSLELTVLIHFPGFIHALPLGLIQTTGDRLIGQIVRQVSRRLTRKVQHDFHSSFDLPYPTRQMSR